jgi:hypothetical protein
MFFGSSKQPHCASKGKGIKSVLELIPQACLPCFCLFLFRKCHTKVSQSNIHIKHISIFLLAWLSITIFLRMLVSSSETHLSKTQLYRVGPCMNDEASQNLRNKFDKFNDHQTGESGQYHMCWYFCLTHSFLFITIKVCHRLGHIPTHSMKNRNCKKISLLRL